MARNGITSYKDNIWYHIKENTNATEEMRSYLMKSMSRKWKDRVDESQWRTLVHYWDIEDATLRSEKNEANRAPLTMPQTSGLKSNSQIREEMIEECGVQQIRMDVYKKTHSRKDWTTTSQAEKKAMDDMDTFHQQNPQSSETHYQTFLTPRIVQSTLLNCPSDLIALSFFLWCAKQPNYFHHREAFDHMVNLVARLTHQLKTVKAIIDQLKSVGVVIKPQTLLLLLRIYWRGGMYAMVSEVFNEILGHGYIPNTYARNILMDVLFKTGQVSNALRVLKETNTPNFLSFSIAMCNLCKFNDLINIQNVLRTMLRRGYYPNAEHFILVLNCHCKLGKIAEALQLLGLMITICGPSASCHVWSILIDGFLKSGKPVTANRMFSKMVELGFTPNVVTLTSLINGFLEPPMLNNAFASLNLSEYEPDLVLCNVLIAGLSKIGRYNDALEVFLSLPKRKLVPDSYTFSSLISTICLSKQFACLPILLRGYVIEPDLVLCNSILNYFCKAGYYSSAVKFYDDMIDRHIIPDRYSYVGLLSGLLGAGRIRDAFNVYKGIVMYNQFDTHVHTVMINGLIKSGNFCTAVGLFRRAVAQNYPLDDVAYSVMLRGCCKVRDFNLVAHIFREMIERGIKLDSSTSNMIMRMMESGRSCPFVLHLLVELFESGLITNKDLHARFDSPDVSMSSSEDLSDAAASVG